MTVALAFLIMVMDGGAKYPGEKIVAVFCPHCSTVHKHRGDQLSVRQARCDEAKSYQVTRWRQP